MFRIFSLLTCPSDIRPLTVVVLRSHLQIHIWIYGQPYPTHGHDDHLPVADQTRNSEADHPYHHQHEHDGDGDGDHAHEHCYR